MVVLTTEKSVSDERIQGDLGSDRSVTSPWFMENCRPDRSGKAKSKLVFLLLRASANSDSILQVWCKFLSAEDR